MKIDMHVDGRKLPLALSIIQCKQWRKVTQEWTFYGDGHRYMEMDADNQHPNECSVP